MGIERIAMLKYGIDDLRLFSEMIKDSLSSSGAYIRLLILLIILINDSWAQILPSSFGAHHKKNDRQ